MIRRLRQSLESAAFQRQLAHLAQSHPAGTPISVAIGLGSGPENWLSRLPEGKSPFWYWARPGRGEYRLGLGHAHQVDCAGTGRFAELDRAFAQFAEQWRPAGRPCAFVGFAFDARTGQEMPNARLAIPALQLLNRQGECEAIVTGRAESLAADCRTWLAALAEQAAVSDIPAVRRQAAPLADQAWLSRVEAALAAIEGGQLAKVVLARQASLVGDRSIPAAPVLAKLLEGQPGSTLYAHGHGRNVFLGATPESLVSLRRGQIQADALAGTAWPGSQRLQADKNLREQALVAEAVRQALAPFCQGLAETPNPRALQVGALSHLHSRLGGMARPGISLLQLAEALHPTPAVGGSPASAALDWLRQEGEERLGWYSGGIGYLEADGDGEIAVALRCALITGQRAVLQAGAGIVAGSCPRQEWAETEAKLATLLDALREPARQEMTETC